MKKSVVGLFLLSMSLLGASSTKARAEFEPIPGEIKPVYIKAVVSFLQEHYHRFFCNVTNWHDWKDDEVVLAINNISYKSPIALIDKSGSQPLFEFSDEQRSHITSFVTSTDYKKIMSFKIEEFSIAEVNSGDFLSPHFVIVRRPLNTINCNLKEDLK